MNPKLTQYNRILNAVRSRLGVAPALSHRQLLGSTVNIRYGMLKESPDMDTGWLYALITQCSGLFDVGSNVGLISLLACLDDVNRRVVTVDANPKALAVAAENLFLNGFSQQVQFVLAFVSDSTNTEIDFFTTGTGAAGSKFPSHAQTASATNNRIKVKTTTLDLITCNSGFVPDLIKIDIEGAEAEALAGAREVVRRHKPRFFVEMHSNSELPMTANGDKVLTWCREVEYDAYYLKAHQLVTSSESFSHRGRCHLYLQPAGRPYPEYLKGIAQHDSLEKVRSTLEQFGLR